jgi:hypothetical protein
MRRRARVPSTSTDIEPFLLDVEGQHPDGQSWFVYLFALSDCSAFKVGFSCNPLQRICTFSRRYFERFDLSQSVLLQLHRCEQARALEAALKGELASCRTEVPRWVPFEAGGHTEWFSAVYFGDAEVRLHSSVAAHERIHASNAFDLFRAELERVRGSFESWALGQAQNVCGAWACAQRGYAVRDHSAVLRDWLDAYRYFDLALFAEEPEIREFVRASTCLTVTE